MWIDEPYRWLGKKHRISRHDPFILFVKYGFSERFVSGLLHIVADEVFSYVGKKRRKKGKR